MYSPRTYRPHTITITRMLGEDEQGVVISEHFKVDRCRVNRSSLSNVSVDNRNAGTTLTVTIDISDSPDDLCVDIDDLVEFKGSTYKVIGVKELFAPISGNLAFIELSCVNL